MGAGNLRWWTSVCAVIVLISSGTDAEADSTLDLSGEWRETTYHIAQRVEEQEYSHSANEDGEQKIG